MRGIDADGIEENIFAHTVAQHFLHLDQTGGFKRAGVHAMRINQVDDDNFTLEQIIIKMDLFPS